MGWTEANLNRRQGESVRIVAHNEARGNTASSDMSWALHVRMLYRMGCNPSLPSICIISYIVMPMNQFYCLNWSTTQKNLSGRKQTGCKQMGCLSSCNRWTVSNALWRSICQNETGTGCRELRWQIVLWSLGFQPRDVEHKLYSTQTFTALSRAWRLLNLL